MKHLDILLLVRPLANIDPLNVPTKNKIYFHIDFNGV